MHLAHSNGFTIAIDGNYDGRAMKSVEKLSQKCSSQRITLFSRMFSIFGHKTHNTQKVPVRPEKLSSAYLLLVGHTRKNIITVQFDPLKLAALWRENVRHLTSSHFIGDEPDVLLV